jgi:uncharacterized protein (TIGR02246 family)
MRATSSALAVILMFVVDGCSGRSGEEFDQADRDTISKLMQDLIVAYNAKEAAKVAALFADNGAVMPPNASTVQGTASVRSYYEQRFAQGASDLKLEIGDILGAGTMAYATGNYFLNMAPPGGAVRRDRGKFIFIFRGRGDRWLLERLMFSSDFAAEPSS